MKDKVNRNIDDYEELLHLPHYVSRHRQQMPIADRAAQFTPFAAVVGHERAVKEAARHTDRRKELDEMEKAIIDNQLREIDLQLPEAGEVRIVYFMSDEVKSGGHYLTKSGKVKKLDLYSGELIMVDGTRIVIDDIYSVEM